MVDIENYIYSKYALMKSQIDIAYIGFYESFSNRELQELFSTIHHVFVEEYEMMNSRLPTNEYGNHFWAENSRNLILAIEVLLDLEKVLKNTKDEFIIDEYYQEVIEKSMMFLSKSGGSTIPPNMEKILIYYKIPILRKKDTLSLPTVSDKLQNVSLIQVGFGSYANVYYYYDKYYDRKFALKRANPTLTTKEIERFKQEFQQMKKLSSPYVVEVFRYIDDRNEYIMEYMDYTLKAFVEKNPSQLID